MATVYAAQHGIAGHNNEDMPLIELFGEQYRWMLRDIIYFIGNYDEIYYVSHGVNYGADIDRGFNKVNKAAEQLLFSPN